MLVDEEKPKELDAVLDEALRATLATLQLLMDAAHEPEMRLRAARTLYKVVKECKPTFPVNGAAVKPAKPEQTEQIVDQLVSDVMGIEEEESASAAAAPPKALRTVPPEKLQPEKPQVEKPQPKPKPKPVADDEDEAARVPVKYWVALGSLAALLAVFFLWNWLTAPSVPGPEALVRNALNAADADQRSRAASTLNMLKVPAAVAGLRQLAAESQDVAVKVVALRGLADRGDMDSIPLFLDAMESSQQPIREVGYAASRKLLDVSYDKEKELGYTVDGPTEQRARATRVLREQYKETVEARRRHREEYGNASGK